VHVTRRIALAHIAVGAPLVLSGCDLAARTAPARQAAIYEVLAPEALGKRRRLDAWNTRYGDETGVRLSPVSPAARFQSLGPAAAAQQLSQGAAMGSQPGIAWLSHDHLQDVARPGALRPLDSLVRRDRYDLKAFMPCALQPAFALDGRLVSLPDEVDAGQLYFNRRHLLEAGIDFRRAGLDFERPDSRWETLRRVALDLLFVRRDQAPWLPTTLPLDVWGWANGGGWLTDDGRRATFDRAENVEALSWLVSAAGEAGGPRLPPPEHALPPARSGTDADLVPGHPFLEGRVSLWPDSGRFMSTLIWTQPDFPIGYVESPRRRSGAPLVTWARSSGYVLPAGAPDALWPALRFLVSEDAALVDAAAEAAQAPLAGASGKPRWYAPFTGQLRADKFLGSRYRIESKIPDEGRDHALEQLRHARPRERCPAAAQVWPLLREAQIAALRGTSARQALEQAQRQAQGILDEAWRGTR
jgi:ABC-type glycerol-3-phosphate transport system substrate-binding protein